MDLFMLILGYLIIGGLANMAITVYFMLDNESGYGYRDPFHDESLGYVLLWPVFVIAGIIIGILYVVRNIGGSTARAVKRLRGQ